MGNQIYEERPNEITQRLQQLLKPLRYDLAFNQRGMLVSIKKGCNSKPCPYFYKDKRGKIYMKLNGVHRCIDYETNEWLAYYAYKQVIKDE